MELPIFAANLFTFVPSKVSARSTPTGAAATKSSKATTISVAASTTATASSTAAHQISQKEED